MSDTCVDCGAKAKEWVDYCEACWPAALHRRQQSRDWLDKLGVSERAGNAIAKGVGYGGPDAVKAATDRELLDCMNVGPKMLAEFRAVWPAPVQPEPAANHCATCTCWSD